MAPRFDFERLILSLSVHDLLDQQLLRSLGFANRGGYERMWLGQAIHSRYQEQALAADPSYRREVRVDYSFQHRGWEVQIQGRMDGLRRDPDGSQVVEEIKSVRRGGQLPPATREIYERQALLYAWMLSRIAVGEEAMVPAVGEHGDEGAAEKADEEAVPVNQESREAASAPESAHSPRPAKVVVRAELVLIEIGGEAIERLPVEADLRALEAGVKRRINALIRAAEGERMAMLARQEAAVELAFPYPQQRTGQSEIIAAVETALEHREHLLLEATTGIGKTVSALYPALRYCLQHGKHLFVLTAKTLQQDMSMKVLELLNARGAFHALRLRAKAKMCANDQVICHEEYCPFAKDYYLKVHTTGITSRLLDQYPSLEPDRIFAAAKRDEVCPFEVSLELSGRVQVTVCDYNYAFDPYVALGGFGADADLSDTVLVIDEIHNLVGRGRGYYSPELSSAGARAAAETIARGGERLHLRLAKLCLSVANLIEETVEDALGRWSQHGEAAEGGYERSAEAGLPEEALWQLRPAFDSAFIDYLEYQRETKSFRPDDPFVTLYFDFLRFLDGLLLSDDSFSHCVEWVGEDRRLRVLCRDPSRFLGAIINRCHSVVGLSATLSPPEFYRDLLGFEAGRTAAVSISNPFPPENRRVVIDSGVATTYRERPANYEPIARRLAAFAEAVPGNCLALFPSYSFLADVAARMPAISKRVLLQHRSSGDREREEILDHLRSALLENVFLLAVAGGVFAEGVDYPGDMLRAVAVVGPCLPGMTLEQRLLKEYYEERFERGFEYAFVVPGMTRVVQAAGRLIRSAEDTGVIALFDKRFLRHPYRKHLPSDWLPEGGLKALTGIPAEVAGDFFGNLRSP
jgi:DNA excision repair protein ERCC-2